MSLLWSGGAEMRDKAAYYDLEQSILIYTDFTRGSWSGASFGTSTSAGSGQATLAAAVSEIYVGGGWYYDSVSSPSTSGSSLAGLLGVGSAVDAPQTCFTVSGGVISARRGGSGGTVLGSSSLTLSPNRWYFIEARIVISDTVGVVQLWVDGVLWIDLSSQDTKNTASTTCSTIIHGGNNSWRWDDLYALSTAGSAPWDTRLGDIGIPRISPSGTGGLSQWTRLSGSANYEMVDETTADDDTTYNYSSVVDDKDLYTCTDLPAALDEALGVTVYLKAKKTDAGAASIAVGVKYDSDANGTPDTESYGSDEALSTGYAWHKRLLETQPDASAWSTAKVNALEIGMKAH